MNKCSEKFKQMVIFGAADLPHNKRQHLLSRYTISVTVCYTRDFPVDLPSRAVEESEKAASQNPSRVGGKQAFVKEGGGSNMNDSATNNQAGESKGMGAAAASEGGVPGTQTRSMLMEETAARILASSHDSNP